MNLCLINGKINKTITVEIFSKKLLKVMDVNVYNTLVMSIYQPLARVLLLRVFILIETQLTDEVKHYNHRTM